MSVYMRVYKSGHITWVADVKVHGRRKRGNFATRKEAREAEAMWRRGLQISSYRRGKVPTFSEWIDIILAEHVHNGEHRTASEIELYLKKFADEFGPITIDRITPDDIQSYLARIKRRGYNGKPQSGYTNNRYRAWLHHVFSIAERRGIITRNPVRATERYKEPARVRWLESKEIETLLDVCHPTLYPLILIALNTGMRQGELLDLTWADVDFSRREITVRRESAKSSSTRTIPMNEGVWEYLKTSYELSDGSGFVFRRADGNPLKSFPKKHWKAAVQKSGIATAEEERLEGFRFQDLRHTAATKMLEAWATL